MKLKLTSSQFATLFSVCNAKLQEELPVDMHEKLVHVLLTKLFKRLYNLSFEKKSKYSLTLKPEEALAFWLTFNAHDFGYASHAGNLLTTICNLIHQRYEMPNLLT